MGLEPGNKIQIVTQNLMQPAKCCVCHFSTDGIRKFIDFQLQIERYGAVYICEFCCANVGQAVDMVPAQDFERVTVLLQETIEHKDQLAEELENANSQLGVIRSFINIPDGSVAGNSDESEIVGNDAESADSVEPEGNGITESDSDTGDGLETQSTLNARHPRIDL